MIRFASLTLIVLALIAGLAGAQTVWTFDAGAPGLIMPTYLPSPSHPLGAPGFTGPGPVPAAAAFGGFPNVNGGVAIDQTTNRVFSCDGFGITIDSHPLYVPFSGPVTPPLGPFPAPLLSPLGTPITGMGCDPLTGTLWLTDGLSYAPCTMAPPFVLTAAPMPLPFLTPGVRLTGIDHDQATGTLWGVDAVGAVYHWTPFGGPIGPQPVAGVPAISNFPFTGIAVNETNGAGSLGAPFCSTQLPGYHVVVTEGLAIHDALVAANPPIPAGFSTGTGAHGLAYGADQQYLPGSSPVAPIPVGITGWKKAQHNGPGGMNTLILKGAMPSTLALFLYDICPIPGGLAIPASGETLWVNPLSMSFGFATLSTDAAGDIFAPVDFSPAVAGITFCGQFAVFSPSSPLGYALTEAMQFTSGLQ